MIYLRLRLQTITFRNTKARKAKKLNAVLERATQRNEFYKSNTLILKKGVFSFEKSLMKRMNTEKVAKESVCKCNAMDKNIKQKVRL